jgi:hypothetical protein
MAALLGSQQLFFVNLLEAVFVDIWRRVDRIRQCVGPPYGPVM